MRLRKSMKKLDYTRMEALQSELMEFQNRMITLTLEGRKSSPEDIIHAYEIAEKGTYMRDYIDNDGIIEQVDFIYVKEDEHPL